MERHVKERLIGATILLVLVVLLVPEFLSGPKPPPPPPASLPVPVHTYTVDLNDPSSATWQEPASVASVAVSAPAAVPVAPSTSPAETETPARSTSPAPIESAPNTPTETVTARNAVDPPVVDGSPAEAPARTGTAPVIAPRPRHTVANGAWSVQLGSFASKPNAEKLAKLLEVKGYAVAISPIGAGSAARYRVRIGQLVDREAAVRMIGRLQSQGHPATIVPPG